MKLFKDRKEFLLAFLIAIAAAAFSLLPTVYAWLNTPEGYWFTGVSSFFDPWDINTYFAAMRQGFDGAWFYRPSYNPFDTWRVPAHLTYLFLGNLSRTFKLSIPTIYHVASFTLGIVFLLFVYLFIRFFLKNKFWSLLCLYLVAFGGGFGFVGIFEGILLPDAAWPDATIFQTLHLPHLILDQTLFLGVLLLSFRTLTTFSWRYGFLAAVAGVGLGFIHPYSLFVADVVAAFLLLGLWLKDRNWRRVRFLSPLVFVSIMTGSYFLKIFYLDNFSGGPLLVGSAAVGYETRSVWLLLGYGLVAVLALVGVYHLWREKTSQSLLLLSWFFGHFLALHLPVPWQRIMIKSFFIAVCLLAISGMRVLRLRKSWIALAMVLLFSSLTNLSILVYTLAIARAENPWVYLASEKHQALEWLRQNLSDNVVLASPELATMVAANSSNFAYMAYQDARADAVEREKIENFYQGRLESPQKFLQERKITYIIGGAGEGNLDGVDYLGKVYENEKVKIYKVL